MQKFLLGAILCGICAAASAAPADKPQKDGRQRFICTQYAPETRMNANRLQQKIVADGYTINHFDYGKNHCYTLRGTDKNGALVRVFFDAKTGAALHSEAWKKDKRKKGGKKKPAAEQNPV